MSAAVVSVGRHGYDYAAECLRYGLASSRAALAWIEQMSATAMIPSGAPEDSRFDFAHAVGGSTRNELTALVLERFAGCLLIVELPLRRPGESRGANDRFELVVRGGDVLAVCTIGEPAEIVADALISQPAAFLYNAFVIDDNPTTRAWLNSVGDEFVSDACQLRLVIVGAYDGDGFVLLTVDDLRPCLTWMPWLWRAS